MKKLFVLSALIATAMVMFVVAPVLALQEAPPPSGLEVILSVFLQFGQLAGVGAVIAALVNVGKVLKLVKDDTAGKWFAGLSLLAVGALVYLKLFQPQIAIEYIDTQAAALAQILLLILGYVVQLGSGIFAHGVFADLKLPFIGKSFSRTGG